MAYQFQPYDNTQSSLTIGQLMQQAAQAQAQGIRGSAAARAGALINGGNARAAAAGTIGGIIAGIPSQIRAQQTAQQNQQIGAQQLEAGAMNLDQAKQGEAFKKTLNQIMKNTPQVQEDGVAVYDVPAIAKQVADAGFGASVGELTKSLGGLNDGFRSAQGAKMALFRTAAEQIARAGNDPDLAMLFLEHAAQNGTISKDQADAYKAFIAKDPANVAKLTASLMAPQKAIIAKPGDRGIDPVTNQELFNVPDKAVPPTPASIAMDAAAGNPQAVAANDLLHPAPQPTTAAADERYRSIKTAQNAGRSVNAEDAAWAKAYEGQKNLSRSSSDVATAVSSGNVKDVIGGMKKGILPPLLPGRASKEYVELMAEAARQDFDLAGAATDWMATQKHVSSLNSNQQLRLGQAISALPELLDSVAALSKKWQGGRFPALNKAVLATAMSGALGKDASVIANSLHSQIADVVGDLGTVYMGGNSPTDQGLALAQQALSADWDADVLAKMVELAKKNVQIRKNSINNVGVQGASADNPYDGQDRPAPASADASGVKGGTVSVTDPNGKVHTFPDQAGADKFKALAGIK